MKLVYLSAFVALLASVWVIQSETDNRSAFVVSEPQGVGVATRDDGMTLTVGPRVLLEARQR